MKNVPFAPFEVTVKQYLQDRQVRAILVIGTTRSAVIMAHIILLKAITYLPQVVGDATHSGIAATLVLFSLAILAGVVQSNILAVGLLVLVTLQYADQIEATLRKTQMNIFILWPARWAYKTRIRHRK